MTGVRDFESETVSDVRQCAVSRYCIDYPYRLRTAPSVPRVCINTIVCRGLSCRTVGGICIFFKGESLISLCGACARPELTPALHRNAGTQEDGALHILLHRGAQGCIAHESVTQLTAAGQFQRSKARAAVVGRPSVRLGPTM